MAGVWEVKDGAYRLVDNHNPPKGQRRQVLVDAPTGEEVTSYTVLEEKLSELGWEKYGDDHPQILRFRQESTALLIYLPKDFAKFKLEHMEDVVAKNSGAFFVRDG
ncbi:unnamed protein product [Linum tenue]|uniref:Uncharacterized protein n=1 Tax=Linum tenue TaxID=586396 RepID=A0AAV0P7J7_9ROSI|nr:unnamed protein product [Linum tenue]CAI0467406.1 unnamed protein product [Linum tenue]